MSVERLRLHLSVLAVELEFHDVPSAARILRTVWQAASMPAVPARIESRYVVEHRDGGYAIVDRRGGIRIVPQVDDVAPALEQIVYADVLYAHEVAGLTLLHAAAFADGERSFIVLGDSGAGKSALARAAVETGLAYLADEHVVTDGERLFGLPRAIQLDPVACDAPPLPWHEGTDRETYRFRDERDAAVVLPLFPVAPERVASPCRLERTVLVAARHGETDAVGSLDVGTALACVERCTLVGSIAGAVGLARVVERRSLVWRQPANALALLRTSVA